MPLNLRLPTISKQELTTNMNKYFLTSLFFLFTLLSYAQDSINVYSWRYIFATDKILSPNWYFLFKLDDRVTFLRNTSVDIAGIQLGFQRKRWKFWAGYAYIQAPSRTRISTIKNREKLDSLKTTTNLNLNYGTVMPEYIVLFHPHFELSVATGFGLGFSDFNKTVVDEIGNRVIENNDTQRLFIAAEPALKGVLRATRWVGFSGSIGYRKSLVLSNTAIDYDGWFYAYGVSFFIGTMFDDALRAWKGRKVLLGKIRKEYQ